MIRAVLFDLDATLTDRPASMAKFCEPFLQRHGDRLRPIEPAGLLAIIQAADAGGYRSRSEMCRELVTNLPWLGAPTAEEIEAFWWQEFPRCAVATAGVPDLLDSLGALGLSAGIVTNGASAVQNVKIDVLGLRSYMKAVVVSDELGVEKPNPAIFHDALTLIGAKAAEAVFVGDDPRRDIEGAREAGLHPVWYRGGRTWPLESLPPRHAIDALPQVLEVLRHFEVSGTA